MKVIFLDCDGVINSRRTVLALGDCRPHVKDVDPIAIKLIGWIVNETGAKIVISSTWRMFYPLGWFTAMFKEFGQHHVEVIDKTPRDGTIRGNEIADWLSAHPEVLNYVIIDDDADMLEEQFPNFVRTSGRDGLLVDHAHRAVEILKGDKTSVYRDDFFDEGDEL